MSLATFKKKSINKYSSASKHSGKPTNEYWIYQGPYGVKGNLPSTIFNASLVGPNGQVGGNDYNASNSGFSINGAYRNIGAVGQHMLFSQSHTPYRGIYPKGWGGNKGRYPSGPDNVVLTFTPTNTPHVSVQNSIVKPSVLSTRGMLQRRFRWAFSGQYPNNWVQPNYTGNQTDSASQGLYVQNKSAANDCFYDVNDSENYVNYYKNYGSTGCRTTPARGYTMNVLQANAPYTKTLHQPKDSSAYTLRVQRRCQNPVGLQKPYPYAVQTGTGVLKGGINVSNVASACNTSNTNVSPPDWYTEAKIIDGRRTTIADQLRALEKKVDPAIQKQVFTDIILNGTTSG